MTRYRLLPILALIWLAAACKPLTPTPTPTATRPTTVEPTVSPTASIPTPTHTATVTPTPKPTVTAAPASPSELATRLITSPAGDVQLSGDGRFAVYHVSMRQVYLHNLEADTKTLVTAARDGARADGWSWAPSISADGSTIAFFSSASNLAEDPYRECPQAESGEPEPCGSLYIYDVTTGALEQMPVAAGFPIGLDTALSADGRFVGFAVPHAFLHEGVFLYDRATGTTTTVMLGDTSPMRVIQDPDTGGFIVDKPQKTGGFLVDISADGRYLAFASANDGIVPDDTNGTTDVFVYDRDTGQIERISMPIDGVESGQPSGFQSVPNTGGAFEKGLAISADGRYVVFMSAAPNLVDRELPACPHWPWSDVTFPACRHIYLHDREMDTTELISVSDTGEPGNRASQDGDISADGRWVVFTSFADNLTADSSIKCWDLYRGDCPQVYVRDRQQGRTYLVSRGRGGQPPHAHVSSGVITPDGHYVAFISSDHHAFVTDLFMLLGVEDDSDPDTTFLVDLQPPIGRVLWFRPDGLWLVEPETETLQRVVREASVAAWSPDSNRLALLGPPPPGAAAENASFLVPTVVDLLTREAHTFRKVHLSPGGGLVWQNVAGTVYLYGVSADEPACLVRLDPNRRTALLDVCVDQDGATRFSGDIIALPDGRLAHVVLSQGDQPTGGEAILRLVDPMTGEAETSSLFKRSDWQPGNQPDMLRVPMPLSPDGQLLAILIGPDVDPNASISDQQGLYLLDLNAGKLRHVLRSQGLLWAAWSSNTLTDTGGKQLAVSGLVDSRPELFVYDREVNRVRRLSPFVTPRLFTLITSHVLQLDGISITPLGWRADGRLLLGVHPQSLDPDGAHPRMAWVKPSPVETILAGPYAHELDAWPTYSLEEAGLAVHYPPDWSVREWPSDGQNVVARSVSFIPARYTASDQPQVPEIGLAVFRPPLTDTLRAWLDTHSTTAPFGSQAEAHVHFFGVRDVAEVTANGLPALRFVHDVFGSAAHELLLANGEAVIGLGYVDFGAEDLGAAFLHMRESLSPEAIDPPAGLTYRTEGGLWRAEADGQSALVVDRPDAVLSPDHTRAVYAEDDDVWLIDVRTGERRNLTDTSDRIAMFPRWWPAWPDTILFSSWPKDRWGPSTGYMTVVRTDGSGYHVLEEQQVSYGLPAPSPDGQLIAYDREGTPWLYRQGVGPESLDPARYGLRRQGTLRIASPAWSPDGKQLAWVVGNYSGGEEEMGIGVFDLAKQTVQFLHPHDPLGVGGWPPAPVWSPDGAWLAYDALSDDFVKSGVWVLRANGSEERFLGQGSHPLWSPDGGWLAFTFTEPSGGSAIRLAEVGTWRLHQVIFPEDAALVDWITR